MMNENQIKELLKEYKIFMHKASKEEHTDDFYYYNSKVSLLELILLSDCESYNER